jgi:hypothetical protein
MIPKRLNRRSVSALKDRLRALGDRDPATWTHEEAVDLLLGPDIVKKYEAGEAARLANRKPLPRRIATGALYVALTICGVALFVPLARGIAAFAAAFGSELDRWGAWAIASGLAAVIILFLRRRL